MDTQNTKHVPRAFLRFFLYAQVVMVLLTALFYGVEDLRGWLAWRGYKADTAAHGVKLDWAAFIPPKVPDDQNFFKAPNMQWWFVGRSNNTFAQRISFNNYEQWANDRQKHPVAKVILVPANTVVGPRAADIVLQYDHRYLSWAAEKIEALGSTEVIPVIRMEEVPLGDAIKNLARQAGINYLIDPVCGINRADRSQDVTSRWTDRTAAQVLAEVLQKDNLELIPDPQTGVARVVKSGSLVLNSSYGHGHVASTLGQTNVIPLIVMDEVPLADAIKNLARQCEISYTLDPSLKLDSAGAKQLVTLRWEGLAPGQALTALLHNYNFDLARDPQTGIYRITRIDNSGSMVRAAPDIRAQLATLIKAAVNSASSGPGETHLLGCAGIELVAGPADQLKTARVVVLTDGTPSARVIKDFFPPNPLDNGQWNYFQVNVEPEGSNGFNIYLNPALVTAADYLAWSDQFKDDFANISAALQRPYARMDGDYSTAGEPPIPNFITVRLLAQMLGQRAQSYLLLGQPHQALDELTLLHNLSRVMEARPTGKPMTLISGMINVAVTGLYTTVVADGLRLHVWSEPQLAALQQQFAEINLPPFIHDSFEFEAAIHGHQAEALSSRQLAEKHYKEAQAFSSVRVEKFRDPTCLFLLLSPHGWVYQNAVRAGRLELGIRDGFDLNNHLFFPKRSDDGMRGIETAFHQVSPYNYYAAQLVPNFTRAIQVTAQNQTLVNEAGIACALERHRLAHGRYPNSLDELSTEFATQFPADLIGGGPLKYRVDDGRFVLYSVGWNERDDGGKPCWDKHLTGDVTKNDWAWPYQEESTAK